MSQSHSYTNPVYAGSMPDPSVIRYQGSITPSEPREPPARPMAGFHGAAFSGPGDWEPLGGALVPPSPDRRAQYWAPEATFNDGKFYLYYSFGGLETEKFELRVATSARPEGPYMDTGSNARGLRDEPLHHRPVPVSG